MTTKSITSLNTDEIVNRKSEEKHMKRRNAKKQTQLRKQQRKRKKEKCYA